jgi:pimeloyl-ACP methyl ester carboxylesterase
MRLLPLLALLLAAPALAQSPAGDWSGDIEVGAPEPLTLILRVAPEDDGYTATLDVPQQGATGLPASSVRAPGDSLVVGLDGFGIEFRLAVAEDSLYGEFEQGMNTLPIVMTPTDPLRRPQTPEGPFPYATEEVAVEVGPGVTLAGTFARPEGEGPFPVVVLLSGSGPQDRDATLAGGHRPFAVIADALARAGVATLRADDRGTGASTGDFSEATLDTHAEDARALVALARVRPDVDRVGVLGASEGGLTALRLAGGAGGVDSVVTLAGPAVPFEEIFPVQLERAVRLAGIDSSAAATYGRAVAATIAPLVAAPDAPADSLRPVLDRTFNEGLREIPTGDRMQMGLGGPAYRQVKDAFIGSLLSPGLRSLLAYDPAPDLAALDAPLLALYGGLDYQVPADLNADAVRALDGEDVTVVVVEDANHLFQTAETGGPGEYGQIEETIAPETLALVVSWIAETAGAEAGAE